MFKILRWIFLTLVVLTVAAILIFQPITTWLTESSVEKLTGFTVTIDYLNLKLLQSRGIARNITIYNPKGSYKEPIAMKIQLIEADYQLGSFFQKEPHFQKLVLDIPQVIIVKNAAGEINFKRFQSDQKSEKSNFHIDELIVSLGEVVYLDESKKEAKPVTYKIQTKNRSYRNIHSSEDLKKLILNQVINAVPENMLGLALQSVNPHIEMNLPTLLEQSKTGLQKLFKSDRQN